MILLIAIELLEQKRPRLAMMVSQKMKTGMKRRMLKMMVRVRMLSTETFARMWSARALSPFASALAMIFLAR